MNSIEKEGLSLELDSMESTLKPSLGELIKGKECINLDMEKEKPKRKENLPKKRNRNLFGTPSIIEPAYERLASILRDPSCITLSVTKICKLADISRTTYYQLFKDSEFVSQIEQEAQELLIRNDLPVLHNIAERAKDPNAKSHHWSQMFMQMKGRLSDQPIRPAQISIVFNVNRPSVVDKGDTIEITQDKNS